jgi:2-polyprenyl-6-methoxyphenol hydroxylase-like FAD-dependent oxidoreductase
MIQRWRVGEILHAHAVKAGVEMLFGRHVVGVDDTGPSIKLEGGIEITADLIIAADGEF